MTWCQNLTLSKFGIDREMNRAIEISTKELTEEHDLSKKQVKMIQTEQKSEKARWENPKSFTKKSFLFMDSVASTPE